MHVTTVNLTACESFLLISHPYIIAEKIQQLLAFCADIGDTEGFGCLHW